MTEANEIIKKLFDTLDDEKNGTQAKRGFRYQDWWCTGKIFSIWAESESVDFALGVEIKEDAVFIDSIENPQKLEFYQIKKRENKNWLISDLIRVETQEKSIVSKLYYRWQTFKPTDIKLFFITNSSLKTKNGRKDIFHNSINFETNLIDLDKIKIKDCLKKQLSINNAEEIELNRINFLVSNLPLNDTDKHIYGVIYDLNSENKLPISIKNINVAANYITNIFNKISADPNYATNLTKILTRCITRIQLEQVVNIIEKNNIDPEEILKKGLKKLESESYPHRKLQKLDFLSSEVLLDLRNRSKSRIQSLFKDIDNYYINNENTLDNFISLSSIVDHVSEKILAKENNGFFSLEYIKCSVLIYDISNGKIYCEKFFNI